MVDHSTCCGHAPTHAGLPCSWPLPNDEHCPCKGSIAAERDVEGASVVTDLSPTRREAIGAREAAATEGPWTFHNGDVWRGDVADALARVDAGDEASWPYADDEHPKLFWGDPIRAVDAEFIAHARADIPALLAAHDTMAARIDAVRALVSEGSNAPVLRADEHDTVVWTVTLGQVLRALTVSPPSPRRRHP